MKKLIVLVLILVLSGCAASTFRPTGACVEGASVILGLSDNPTNIHRSLLMVNLIGLEKKQFTAEQAVEFFAEVESMASSGITYRNFATWLGLEIEKINKYLGVAMIISGDEIFALGVAGGAVPISDCDLQLVLYHVANQKQLAYLYQ